MLVEYHVHETLVLLYHLVASDEPLVVQPCITIKEVTPLPFLPIFRTNLAIAYQI